MKNVIKHKKKRSLSDLSIKSNLIILISTFVLIPLFITLIVNIIIIRSTKISAITKSNELMVLQASQKIEAVIETINYSTSSILTSTSDIQAIKTINQSHNNYEIYQAKYYLNERMKTIKSNAFNSFNGEIAILTNQGELISSNNIYLLNFNYKDRAWYKNIIKNGRIPFWDSSIAEIFTDSDVSALENLTMGRAIQDYNGDVWGVIIVRLPSNAIWGKPLSGNLLDFGHMSILSEDGRVLSTNIPDKQLKLSPQKKEEILNFKSDGAFSGMVDKNTFYTASKIKAADNILLYTARYADVFAESSKITYSTSLAMILIALITCIVLLILSNRFSRPIKDLISDMQVIEQKKFTELNQRSGFREINELVENFNIAQERIQLLIEQVRSESHLKEKAYYEALQAQINPHFLFNTLNAIKWMASINGDQNVSNTLSDLGVVLAATYNNKNEIGPINQELQILDSYVNIMKMRFGSTFKYICSVSEEVSCCKMPKFCLQPLVENSILHGVSKNQAGIILLTAEKFEGVVEFTVTDNGEGTKKDDIDKILRPESQTNGKITGLGLANVDKRIKIMFGEEYGLTIDRDVTIGFKIRLKIPVIV